MPIRKPKILNFNPKHVGSSGRVADIEEAAVDFAERPLAGEHFSMQL